MAELYNEPSSLQYQWLDSTWQSHLTFDCPRCRATRATTSPRRWFRVIAAMMASQKCQCSDIWFYDEFPCMGPAFNELSDQDKEMHLKHPDYLIRNAAIEVLSKQPTLRDDILKAIMERLEHPDSLVRKTAIKFLGKQSMFSDDISRLISTYLKHDYSYVQSAALDVISNFHDLPNDVLQDVIACLKSKTGYIRREAVEVLGNLAPHLF